MTTLDFYFDIYSPYAYLGFHRVLEIASDQQCEINFIPVDLPRLKVAAGNTGPANVAIPPKIKYLMTDLKRWAALYNLPFGDIPKGKEYARINKGVFYAIAHDRAKAYIKDAYALVWGRGGNANDDDELKALATKQQWKVDEFMNYLDSDEANTAFEASNQQAITGGVFGVPTVVLDGNMWWGNDRMDFLQRHLTEMI